MPNPVQRAIAHVRQQINVHKSNTEVKAKATHATDEYQAQNCYDPLVVLHHKHGDGKKLHINHGKTGAYLSKNVPNWVKKLVYHGKRQSRSEVVQSVADKGLNSNNPLAQQAAKDLLALTSGGLVNGPELRTAAWTIQNPGKPNPYDEMELSTPQFDAGLDEAYRKDVEQGAFDEADRLLAPAPSSTTVQENDTDEDLIAEITDAMRMVLPSQTKAAIDTTNSEVSDSLVDGGRVRFAPTLLRNLPQPPEVESDQRLSDLDKLNYYLDKTNLLDQVGKGDRHALIEYRSELLKDEEKRQQTV
jgi:hypothetical protein